MRMIRSELYRFLHMQKQQDDVLKKAQVAHKHLQAKAAEATREAKAKQGDDKQLHRDLDRRKADLQAAQQAHDAIQLDQGRLQQLRHTAAQQRREVEQLQGQRQQQGRSISSIVDFSFSNPHANFDRSTVRGILARLVQIKDSKHAVALEVAAGAKLYHLVVNTDQVGVILVVVPPAVERMAPPALLFCRAMHL